LDVIILSNTANIEYYKLLEQCINSLKNNDIKYNIIVVETNFKLKNKKIPLDSVNFIFPGEKFNYNKFLNIGIEQSKTDTILISNNDIVYDPKCLDFLYNGLNFYSSVSPYDKNHHPKFFKDVTDKFIEGYDVGKHVVGYSIMFKKEILKYIGKFDEHFKFWYQDNDYCNLLKKYNLKHALIMDAQCYHYGEQSHNLLSQKDLYENTYKSVNILNEKWENK